MEFGDFSKISEKIWNQSISKALKLDNIADFERRKYQDLELPSFNFPEPVSSFNEPLICGSDGWLIGSKVETEDSNKNANILSSLNHGASAIQLSLNSDDALKDCLNEVYLSMIYMDLDPCTTDDSLAEYLELSQDSKKSILRGAINFQKLSTEKQNTVKELNQFHLLTIESKAETITEELAELARKIVDAIDFVTKNNLSLSQVRLDTKVGVYLPANVAKLRAIRLLWANLLKAYDQDFQALFIVANTEISPSASAENKLIENTTATINAAIGTANLIYGGNLGTEDGRLHQNIQHILKLESNLHQIVDPMAGSYAIENLSTSLAEKAWNSLPS